MILKQHLMLINEKENIIRVYRTSLAFCAVPSLSLVCGFVGAPFVIFTFVPVLTLLEFILGVGLYIRTSNLIWHCQS